MHILTVIFTFSRLSAAWFDSAPVGGAEHVKALWFQFLCSKCLNFSWMSSWLSVVFERITSNNPSIPQQRLVPWQISAPDLDFKFRVCVIAITDFSRRCDAAMLWGHSSDQTGWYLHTHTHTSCVSPTQSDLRWDQSSDELQVGTGKIRSLDGDRSGAGWQGGLASISVPPPHPSLRSEVTSSSPLCSQAENCPFWRWAASAPWHRAQNAAVHRLLHPSAAQRYLRPPAVDLTLLLLPPRCCCSLLWSQ